MEHPIGSGKRGKRYPMRANSTCVHVWVSEETNDALVALAESKGWSKGRMARHLVGIGIRFAEQVDQEVKELKEQLHER